MALPAFVQGFIHGKWNLYVIVLISFAVYANTLFFDFVLDDRVVFTENQYVQKGLAGIPEIFGKETFAGYFKDSGLRSTVSGGRYRPLTLGFFALQNQIAGNNAFLAHLLNVLFFCLMNVVLFKSMSGLLKYRFPEHAVTAAFLATLLFAVHPIHTEVVANVKGLDEIWALGFSLLALNSILNAPAKNNSWSSYAWAGLWFMLAMFSKENAFVFIALIPLSLILFTPYTKTQMLRTMTSLGLGAVLFMTCRIAVVGTQFMQESKNFLENPFLQFRGERLVEMLPADRYGTILYTFLRYVYLHVFPYPLTHDYAPKSIATHSLASPLALAGLVLAAAMVVLALMWRKSKPVYSWSILVFILALLPTSNLFFSVGAYMGERFAFVSSVGFCLALAYWTSAKLLPRSNAYLYAFGMILVLFAGRTVMRNTAWKDNMTLFNTDYRYSSNSAKLNSSLGFTMLENYRNQTDKESHAHLLTQAIFHLKKAGEIYPKYADCFFL
ncbi:MAG TPA: hypothetical protein VFX48_09905, partial [Saprospiraceae bacterium]|nr:hypothetical protein [Saprospiraceae bacterium]